MSKITSGEFLAYLVNNKASEQIEESLKRWIAGELPEITRDQVVAEDITQVNFIRKQAFLKFLPLYTSDITIVIEVIKEIDKFILESEISSFGIYANLQEEKISEHSHFIEKITHTSPIIIYIYDETSQRGVYSNKRIEKLLGYTTEDLKKMGTAVITSVVHPDDLELVTNNFKNFHSALDNEIRTFECRVKDKNNNYRWMRAYESVFKRKEDGSVWQKIGTAIEIHNEKLIAEQLLDRENQLLEAQELTEMGSFVWNFTTRDISVTPQLKKILELDELGKMNEFMNRIHPTDRVKVQQAIDAAIKQNSVYECEYRYRGSAKEKVIWSRGIIYNENENPVMRGTIMDITERHYTIQKLQRSDELFKQSQALTHIGNWTWEVDKNKITWSDELYRIYGLQPQSEDITFERFISFIHPDDSEERTAQLQELLKNPRQHEYIMRIVLDDKSIKTLHGHSEVLVDEEGNAYKMVGTCQDITERQIIVQRLKESEALYKQAQALSHIGNWIWDLRTNELSWSHELYHIYGLDPGLGPVTYDEVYPYTHPDDVELVEKYTKHSIRTHEPNDYFYRIILKNGAIKILHARGEITADASGKAIKMLGTLQDVTERQTLLEKLQRSDSLYRQAALLANMGNWTWNLSTNKIEWTDELFEIYELEPQPVTYELFESFIHADDKKYVTECVDLAIKTLKLDYYYRLVFADGREKIIHSMAEVKTNESGEPVLFIGTAQDVTEKQNLIKKLQRSEELYKQAQALAHIGNWTWDVEKNEVTWSDEVYRIYGIEPQGESITYERYLSLIHPDDREMCQRNIQDCLETHEPYEYYHRIITDKGVLKILQAKGEVVLDQSGNPNKLIGTAQDVTGQQKTEQQVREKQNFIQKIANATPSIITSYNVHTGKYDFINQGLEKLLGHYPESALEQGISFFIDIVHPDDLGPLLEKNEKAMELANQALPLETEIVAEFKYRMRHMDGQYRWFHTYGTVFDRNHENKVEHVLNISLDITDTIAAEQKVKEQEHFISHIADASPILLYLFQLREGRIIYINKEVQSILGYSPEEVIGMDSNITASLYHPEELGQINDQLEKYKNSPAPESLLQFECRMKHKDGDWRWLMIREIVFRQNDEGQITEILGAGSDITTRKKTEFTLSKRTLELQQSNARLEEFAYVASHDLKEPLRKITIFGDKLLSGQHEKLDDEGRAHLTKIIDSAQRMQALIDDLLSVSMISAEKVFESRSLQKIIGEVIQTLEYKIEQSRAVINVQELPEANVIPSQFRQLFQNLLSNSLKFVGKNIQPEISVAHKFLKPQDVVDFPGIAPANRYLKIMFSDNGIGFDQAFAEKIFTIFQRLHGKNEYEGTGIGLSICKKIVENHGGVIYGSGIPGEGACFTIIIPA